MFMQKKSWWFSNFPSDFAPLEPMAAYLEEPLHAFWKNPGAGEDGHVAKKGVSWGILWEK